MAAVLAKVAIACLGGLRLAGPLGLAVAGGGSVAGDRFPIWRFLEGKTEPPADGQRLTTSVSSSSSRLR